MDDRIKAPTATDASTAAVTPIEQPKKYEVTSTLGETYRERRKMPAPRNRAERRAFIQAFKRKARKKVREKQRKGTP